MYRVVLILRGLKPRFWKYLLKNSGQTGHKQLMETVRWYPFLHVSSRFHSKKFLKLWRDIMQFKVIRTPI